MFDFAFREATFIFILKKNKKNQKVCQTEVTFRTFLGLSQIFLNPLFAMYICTCCLLEFFILLFCSVSKLHNFVQSSCKTRVPLSSHCVLNYILVKTSIWIKNFRHSEKKNVICICLFDVLFDLRFRLFDCLAYLHEGSHTLKLSKL